MSETKIKWFQPDDNGEGLPWKQHAFTAGIFGEAEALCNPNIHLLDDSEMFLLFDDVEREILHKEKACKRCLIVNRLKRAFNMTKDKAYRLGFDCGLNGSNLTNCHFSIFATRELTQEWERGKKAGEEVKRVDKLLPKRLL